MAVPEVEADADADAASAWQLSKHICHLIDLFCLPYKRQTTTTRTTATTMSRTRRQIRLPIAAQAADNGSNSSRASTGRHRTDLWLNCDRQAKEKRAREGRGKGECDGIPSAK